MCVFVCVCVCVCVEGGVREGMCVCVCEMCNVDAWTCRKMFMSILQGIHACSHTAGLQTGSTILFCTTQMSIIVALIIISAIRYQQYM